MYKIEVSEWVTMGGLGGAKPPLARVILRYLNVNVHFSEILMFLVVGASPERV